MPLYDMVRPGDLITADLWNMMVDKIQELEARVEQLEEGAETGNQVLITNITPNPVRINEEVEVFGVNFGYSAANMQVQLVRGNNITNITVFKPGTNDNRIVFDVPFLPNIPSDGAPHELVVSNGTTKDSRSVTIRPAQAELAGNVFVKFDSSEPVTPDPVLAGQQADFHFTIESGANLAADFDLSANINIDSNQSAWNNPLQILDSGENPLSGNRLHLDSGEKKEIIVRHPNIPDSPPDAEFSLSVSASANGVSGTSEAKKFTVGEETPPEDDSISITVGQIQFNPSNGGSQTASGLSLQSGAAAWVRLNTEFTKAGTYNMSQDRGGM